MHANFSLPTLPQSNLLEDNLHPNFDYEQQKHWQSIDDGSFTEDDYHSSDAEYQLNSLADSGFFIARDPSKLTAYIPGSDPDLYHMSHSPWQPRGLYAPPHQKLQAGALGPQWTHDQVSMDQESCSNASAWSARGAESHTDYEVMSTGCASWYGQPEAMSPEVAFSKPAVIHSGFVSGQGVASAPVTPHSHAEPHWSIDPSHLSAADMSPPDLEEGRLDCGNQEVHPIDVDLQATIQPATSGPFVVYEETDTALQDEDPNHKPSGRKAKLRRRSAPALARKVPVTSTPSRRVKNSRISKRASNGTARKTQHSPISRKGKEACSECAEHFTSVSALHKHILSSHKRPFSCTFRRYGCLSTFGSKNEWKRHVSSQHLRLGVYRCDQGACRPGARLHHGRKASSSSSSATTSSSASTTPHAQGEQENYNDFNRKDLFTQHVRRMHGPGKHSSSSAAAIAATTTTFEESLEATRKRCWRPVRDPPATSACGFCPCDPTTKQPVVVFSGPRSWDERMEHVGRHLEKCEHDGDEREDGALREWLVREELLQWSTTDRDDGGDGGGGWKIVGVTAAAGGGGGRRKKKKGGEVGGEEEEEDADADGEFE